MKQEILPFFRKIYPRNKDTHKGDYGKIFILAGSVGMTGAAYLSSVSALRAGAGLVYLGIPESLNSVMEMKLTEVITIPLPETKEMTISLRGFKKIEKISYNCDLVIVGPGLSRDKSTQELIRRVVIEIKKPVLLDADGINAFENKVELLRKRKSESIIITPHMGEFSRLLNVPILEIKKDREKFVKKFAQRYRVTTVLKGYKTFVSSNDKRYYINDTGNSGMATAGSGDVLSGLIAGLKVQGLDEFESSSLGVYIHGRAGDIAAEETCELSLIATDILKYIPLVFKELKQEV